MGEMLAAGTPIYGPLKNLIVWAKDNGGMGSFYRSRHELIFVFKNGTAPHINTFELGQNGRYRTNVWQYRGANSFHAGRMDELILHPTVKPVGMIADAIKDVSGRNDLVLDLFGGSGSTLIAAQKTARSARLVEIDPVYCDRIIARWEAYAKDEAELIACGWSTSTTAAVSPSSPPPSSPSPSNPSPSCLVPSSLSPSSHSEISANAGIERAKPDPTFRQSGGAQQEISNSTVGEA